MHKEVMVTHKEVMVTPKEVTTDKVAIVVILKVLITPRVAITPRVPITHKEVMVTPKEVTTAKAGTIVKVGITPRVHTAVIVVGIAKGDRLVVL